ncbi:tol protein [Colletotrichum musicola]|uniref:Tol protein n=1 Tax=Colletotrichum musicola TaxID=2175873 RepID=A0A8H6N8U7_9PEZI|nr:tol protein [Colletotrichum musicola]
MDLAANAKLCDRCRDLDLSLVFADTEDLLDKIDLDSYGKPENVRLFGTALVAIGACSQGVTEWDDELHRSVPVEPETAFLRMRNTLHRYGHIITEWGPDEFSPESCEACRLFYDSRHKEDPRQEPSRWQLRVIPSTDIPLPCRRLVLTNKTWPLSENLHSIVVYLTPPKRARLDHVRIFTGHQDLLCEKTHLIRYDPTEPTLIPRLWSQDMVKDWLDDCRDHGSACNEPRIFQGFRLLDCETVRVVWFDSSEHLRWVALSYVWSIAKDTHKTPKPTSSGPEPAGIPLPDMLPAIILDAISVTRALGFRHLWIDKYCIDQTSPEDKMDQIAKMAAIYSGADLTIVAASEHNGLPGVGETPRKLEGAVNISDCTVFRRATDWRREIVSSIWNTRGWTYQEGALSRRKLYFADTQVMLECKAGFRCETGAGQVSRDVVEETPSLPPGETIKTIGVRDFTNHVTGYSTRSLTFESDTLHAIDGVLQTFRAKHLGGVHSLWGIPSIAPGDGRPLNPEESRVVLERLCWYRPYVCTGKQPGRTRRKDAFPSWSWSGWASGFTTWHKWEVWDSGAAAQYFERTKAVPGLPQPVPSDIAKLPTLKISTTLIPADLFDFSGSFTSMDDFGMLGHYRVSYMPPFGLTVDEFAARLATGTLRFALVAELLLTPEEQAQEFATESFAVLVFEDVGYANFVRRVGLFECSYCPDRGQAEGKFGGIRSWERMRRQGREELLWI